MSKSASSQNPARKKRPYYKKAKPQKPVEELKMPRIVMAPDTAGKMNHSDLVQLAIEHDGLKMRPEFMKLPQELQDTIIEKLDAGEISNFDASRMIKEAGYSLSHESVRKYYFLVCTQRRRFELDYIVLSMSKKYNEMGSDQALKALLNLVATQVSQLVIQGDIHITGKDLSKLITALKDLNDSIGSNRSMRRVDGETIDIEEEAQRKVREIYGI
jgi:hypothetical protein